MASETRRCENYKGLWDLADFVNNQNLDKWGDEIPEDLQDPRYQEFFDDEDRYNEIGDVRRSCPRFVVGVVVEPGRITPDESAKPCQLAPGETCPIQQQVEELQNQYPDFLSQQAKK